MKYSIQTRNINDSLVFYRALFNRMPDELDGWRMRYSLPGFELEVRECRAYVSSSEVLVFEIDDLVQLKILYTRMSRFKAIAKLKDDCHLLLDAFGLLDSDGNKWVIGNPKSEVHFEKCYMQ